MKVYFLFVLYCFWLNTLAQSPSSNQSKIENKGNYNTINVVQSGTLISYNLNNDKDAQNLLNYLREIPSIRKHLNEIGNNIKDIKIKQDKLLLAILSQNASKEKIFSQDEYNKGLEKYIIENNRLKSQISQLEFKYQGTEFSTVLNQAESKLKELDNDGYQQIIEDFKIKRKNKLEQEAIKRQEESEELAQAIYLQSQNSYYQFNYQKALEQIEEALSFNSSKVEYWLLKGNILNSQFSTSEAIATYERINTATLNDSLKSILLNNLGESYYSIGDYNQAINYHTKALDIQLKMLKPEHADIAATYNNLGIASSSKGEYNKAIDYYILALTIQLKIYGPEHPNVASEYGNLGTTYSIQGDYKQAIEYLIKALNILLKVLDSSHPNIAITYENLGMVYHSKGDYSQAMEYLMKGLPILLNVFGPNHPSVASSYNNIGMTYNSIGRYDQAIDFYNKALTIQLKVVGPDHPYVASIYNNLSSVYDNKGDYVHAIDYSIKATSIKLKVFAPDNPSVATSYSNLGVAYSRNGDYDLAIFYIAKGLDIRLKVFGPNHPDVVFSYLHLGNIYNSKRANDQAIIFLLKALNIQLEIFGKESPTTATLFNSLGNAYLEKREYSKAIDYYSSALVIQSKIFGPEYINNALVYGNLGDSHKYKGEFSKAIDIYSKALDIRLKVLGAEHIQTQAFFQNIGLLYIANHQTSKGLSILDKVKGYKKLSDDGKALLFNQIGEKYLDRKQYLTASIFFNLAHHFLEKNQRQNTYELCAFVCQNLAITHCYLKQNYKANKYFNQAIVFAKRISNIELIKEINQNSIYCSKL